MLRQPLTWILFVIAILRGVEIWWGLPASDGWDTDGVAPRDFLPGLAQSFTPGQFYTYPPVHLAILAVLTLPITIIAVIRAPSTAVSAIVHEIIKVPYMTAMAMTARVVSLVMSLLIVVFVARIAEEIRAYADRLERDHPRVKLTGYVTAAFVGVNVSLAYYAHVSNLDVPYMFWGSWSLLCVTRALTRSPDDRPRFFRRAFLFAVLAIGTKDQAYALFLISYPIALIAWLIGQHAEARKKALRELGIALVMAIALFLIVDCVIVNPSGFRARVGFLTGSASQDYATYTNDWNGRTQILADAWHGFRWHYPFLLAPVVLVGIVRAIRLARGSVTKNVVALLPLLAAVSFTIAFNFTARRSDPRFLLPQSVMLGVYGGLGIEWLITPATRRVRLLGQAFVSIGMAKAIWVCIALDANMFFDPRYDAERWLAAHVKPGDVIETYGLNVYMPRPAKLGAGAHLTRVGPEPADKRNPMPGVEEIEAPFMKAPERGARFIVINTGWTWRYHINPETLLIPGKKLPPTQSRSASDVDGTTFFDELYREAGAFMRVETCGYDDHFFPVVDIHGTTTRWVWIYERKKPAP